MCHVMFGKYHRYCMGHTCAKKKFCIIYQKCPLSWTSCILSSSPTGKPVGAVFRAHKSRCVCRCGRERDGAPRRWSGAEREVRGNIKEHEPRGQPSSQVRRLHRQRRSCVMPRKLVLWCPFSASLHIYCIFSGSRKK